MDASFVSGRRSESLVPGICSLAPSRQSVNEGRKGLESVDPAEPSGK